MRNLVLWFLGCSLAAAPLAAADDAAEIKQLVPAASAMAKADFEKLAKSESGPKASDVEEKSLTLMLFTAQIRDDDAAREQFRYLTKVPKPSELVAEIYRAPRFAPKLLLAPVTMIHANRITGLTCDVNDDVAQGTISFEVPQLYAGRVNYVARKQEGKWRIEEFKAPAHEIHVVLGKNSKWEQK